MKRYIPVIITLLVVAIAGFVVVSKKNGKRDTALLQKKENNLGNFSRQPMCARPPQFLQKLKIPQPVIIDLSQKRFKGIALLYGKDFKKVLHPKQWEQYEHFSTYSVDEVGNIYLIPIPYISIHPTTFNLQKNIYKLETKTGKLSIFMHFEDVLSNANNPYGLNAIVYDCEDKTLWVATIDKSDYQSQKGVIYHIDPHNKKILQKVEGFDVLTMQIMRSQKGKYLLVGSARDSGLYAYPIHKGKLSNMAEKLLELPSVNEHIRKIKIEKKNTLKLQSIPFSYTLIAQTAKEDRSHYKAIWNQKTEHWEISKSKL
jgi:hypothetical protein